MEADDPLDRRIEHTSDAGTPTSLWGIIAVIRDADDRAIEVEREESFREARRERYNATWWGAQGHAPPSVVCHCDGRVVGWVLCRSTRESPKSDENWDEAGGAVHRMKFSGLIPADN